MRYLSKKILTIFFAGIVILTTIDYFVYSSAYEVSFANVIGYFLNNTVLLGLILIAYLLMKYFQDRGSAPRK